MAQVAIAVNTAYKKSSPVRREVPRVQKRVGASLSLLQMNCLDAKETEKVEKTRLKSGLSKQQLRQQQLLPVQH